MNNELILHFEKAGLQTSVQDLGRVNHQAFGVPIGGAMDQSAMKSANLLVGNPEDSPVLEITLLGPRIQFEGGGILAICGADLSPRLNGEAIMMNASFKVHSGDILQFGRPKYACRAYLAVGGEWMIPKWLGSYSAAFYLPEATPDSIIKKGSQLLIHSINNETLISYNLPIEVHDIHHINVMLGPEFEAFSKQEIAQFFSQSFKVSNDSNRMGYRLESPFSLAPREKELISSPVLPGTVQITAAGMPIILMRDAQTTGGYYRMLNVISEDINSIAQCKPGDLIRFVMA